MLERTSIIAKNYLTIYAFISLLFSGAAFAVNEYHDKFLTLENFNVILKTQNDNKAKEYVINEIKKLNDEIRDLKIDRKYSIKNRNKLRIDEKILIKETIIKNLMVK